MRGGRRRDVGDGWTMEMQIKAPHIENRATPGLRARPVQTALFISRRIVVANNNCLSSLFFFWFMPGI